MKNSTRIVFLTGVLCLLTTGKEQFKKKQKNKKKGKFNN